MTGYQVFRAILARGDAEPMVEDIIRHIVLFGEDRKLLEQWLTDAYGERLSTEDLACILRDRNKFSDWGNLSETFLRKILHTDPETGEMISIDEALWRTNCNLNELLSTNIRSSTRWNSTAPSNWAQRSRRSKTSSRTATPPPAFAAPSTRASPSSARSKNSWASRPSACSSR